MRPNSFCFNANVLGHKDSRLGPAATSLSPKHQHETSTPECFCKVLFILVLTLSCSTRGQLLRWVFRSFSLNEASSDNLLPAVQLKAASHHNLRRRRFPHARRTGRMNCLHCSILRDQRHKHIFVRICPGLTVLRRRSP